MGMNSTLHEIIVQGILLAWPCALLQLLYNFSKQLCRVTILVHPTAVQNALQYVRSSKGYLKT